LNLNLFLRANKQTTNQQPNNSFLILVYIK